MNTKDINIRVLGKGQTAKAVKEKFPKSILYDDSDFDMYDVNSNDITVVSPGIPPYNDMVKKSKNIQSDYDLFDKEMPFSIWISGTNGKTTTTQMCQHILKKHNSICGGNIGIPLSQLDVNASIWILETSSFTLHYTNKAKPNLYILLPISEDHITWHGSFEEYKKAKIKPISKMEEGEIAIVPHEFKDIRTNAHLITYRDSDDLCKKFGLDKKQLKFNEPFLLDALLALCTKKILFDEVDYLDMNKFVIDEHKVEELYDNQKRLWINDSKATNVDATIKALIPYNDKKLYLILGGDDKGVNLIPLFENIKDLNIEVFAIGSNTNKLLSFCDDYKIKSTKCEFLDIAVKNIDRKLDNNGVGILSPSAASLDQFSSYAVRGKEFKKFVRSLS